jgi:hypothetical protein
MKKRKSQLLLLSLFFLAFGQAQVSKTIHVTNPGTLSTLLTSAELSTVTDLTVTGDIDARDFKTMRDNMISIKTIDLSGVLIKSYNGNEGTSENMTSYPDNELPTKSFASRRNMSVNSVLLPNSVTSIGEQAFYYCYSLKSINFPNSIRSIGNHAFEYCSQLRDVLILSDSLRYIGDFAFYFCYGLSGSLSIPNKVNYIGEAAFSQCRNFNGELILPDSIDDIKQDAFSGCEKLSGSLILPANLKNVGHYAFANCKGFTGQLTFPSAIRSIGTYAFYNCSGFSGSLIIPSSITSISYGVFEGCSGFTGDLIIPPHVKEILTAAFSYCTGFNGNLDIQANLSSIPERTFSHCSGLKSIINFPASLKSIGKAAFYNCSGLTGQLILPDSLIYIDASAFEGCKGFTGSLNIPDKVTSIGFGAFADCVGFNDSLKIPDTVQGIGGACFKGCSGFKGVLKIPSKITVIEHSTFSGCSGFDTLYIPPSVVTIDYSAFSNCTGFKGDLIIPNSVNVIDRQAFYNCSGFDGHLVLPPKINQIGISAFEGCNNFIGSLIIPDYNFGPNLSTHIESYAFANCTGFNEKLIIPASAKWYGDGVFKNCSNFSEINIYNSSPSGIELGTNVFTGMSTDSCVLHVPMESKVLYDVAPQWKDFSTIVEDLIRLPNIVTNIVTSIGPDSAIVIGRIADLGAPKTYKYGVVWDTVKDPTIGLSTKTEIITPIKTGVYFSTIKGLDQGTVYYVRAYATNNTGTSYGNEIIFQSSKLTQLTITNPTIITNKMVDGNTTAVILKLGNLQGLDNSDIGDVSVTATASYDDANVGSNKTITVVYTLSGNAKDKYLAPENYIITNAKISNYITLNQLTSPDNGCEGSSLDLPYIVRTGTPTQYSVTFNSNALNAGMKNINYQLLTNNDSNGSLSIPIPANTLDGNYEGILKMKNELEVESEECPFEFTVNVSSNKIVTKFNELIIFDNADSRFVGYQWLIYGIEIPGATKQYYYSPSGFIGDYSLRLTTNDGKTLYTCPKEFNIFSSLLNQVKISPNPTKQNENFMVSFTGINDNELKNSGLSVYNAQGVCVYKTNIVVYENMLSLNEAGLYIVRIDMPNKRFVSKVVVSQ